MSAYYPVGATRVEGETVATSTTRASVGIPAEYHQAIIYQASTDFRLHLNPAVLDVVYYDNSATSKWVMGGSTSSLRVDLSDRSSGTGTGTVMDSGTTTDRLYICLSEPVGGLYVDVKAVNGNSSTLAAHYYNGSSFAAVSSLSDGTASGGATFAQDGVVTFTAPTDWRSGSLFDQVSDRSAPGTNGYWLRLSWGSALDSDTEIQNLWSINKDTSRGYYRANQEYLFSFDRRAVGALEAVVAADTGTLQITWIRTVQ
jgi:hypothetical protein